MLSASTGLPRSSSSTHLMSGGLQSDRRPTLTTVTQQDQHPLLVRDQPDSNHTNDNNDHRAQSPSCRSPSARLPFDRFSEWVHCVCVVTFDIEEGQAIEKIHPNHVKLTDREKTSICYLSFPDSNSGCMGDTQYHFRAKLCHNRRKSTSSPLQEYNDTSLVGLEAESDFYYGYVYFRQIRDRSAKRGYFQKSLVLLTKLPFITLFKTVVSILANDYFDQGDEVIERAVRDIDHWPALKSGSSERLPLLSTVIQVRIPHKAEALTSINGSATTSLSPTTESKSQFLLLDPNPGMIRNGSFGSLHSPSFNRGFTPSPTILIPSLNELNLFKCFFPVLGQVQTLWELVLTCEPLIVMAATPDVVCEVVQALVSSIWPLKYASDFRPFFTIHDSEFKEFTSTNHSPPPAILGVTNPFFAKALQHWPHVVRIGECMSPQRSKKGLLRVITSDMEPGLHTKYKSFLQKDKSMQRKVDQGMESQRPSEVQSALIRRHLLELTQSFLMPLERYLASLMPLQRSVSPYKSAPIMMPFNPDDFFKLLQISGPQLTSGIRGDWTSLYRKFFRCANFHAWYEGRCAEVNSQLNQIHIKAILSADLLAYAKDKSEVEVVDMVLTLRDKANSDSVTTDDRIQLTSLIKSMVKLLPPDLHSIMNKK